MKICLLAEGCYPYVAGGVSSWIQMLIQGMPEHEFIILAIGAEQKQRGVYKYTLPENVTKVYEYFLDEFTYEEPSMEQYYGNSLLKSGYEMGAHGYNHQSLTLEGGTPVEMGYNPWENDQ